VLKVYKFQIPPIHPPSRRISDLQPGGPRRALDDRQLLRPLLCLSPPLQVLHHEAHRQVDAWPAQAPRLTLHRSCE
jgi:hypothetical protein